MTQNSSLQAAAVDVAVATSVYMDFAMPTAVKVLSSAILDLALAVIKSADVTVSKNSMKRLADLIQENAEANRKAHIERCALRQLQMIAPAA